MIGELLFVVLRGARWPTWYLCRELGKRTSDRIRLCVSICGLSHTRLAMPSRLTAPSQLQPPLLASIPEAMQLLRISRSQIYRMFDSGALTRVKLGALTRIRVSQLRKLAGEIEVSGEAP